jgi:GTP-binding protein SAR1
MTIDLGGHEIVRRIWDNYYTSDVTAIIYVVDTSDTARFTLSARELHNILQNDTMQSVPILILGNKIDKGVTVNEDSLKNELGITDICTGKTNFQVKTRPMEVYMCSLKEGSGYGEGILWLSNFMNK